MSTICSLFTFRNDSFHPETDLLGGISPGISFDREEDEDELFRVRGYHLSETVGDSCGLHYELYEHDERGWIIVFSTAGRYCLIACTTWPDLITLLAKLGPIPLSALIVNDHSNYQAHLPVRVISPYNKTNG